MLLYALNEFIANIHEIGTGLSLAYDIIKAHGGEVIVETNESKVVSYFSSTGIDLLLNVLTEL